MANGRVPRERARWRTSQRCGMDSSAGRDMRIAIDARAMSHPQRGGFRTYTEVLVSALAHRTGHEFTVYTDRPLATCKLARLLHIEVVPIEPPLGPLNVPFREQVRLPRRLSLDLPDVAHFPCNTAPLRCPVPFVVTIHDLLQLDACRDWRRGTRSGWHQAIALYSAVTLRHAARNAAVRQELLRRLRLDPGRVFVSYPALRAGFGPEDPLSPLPCGLEPGFVLAIGAMDPRKNLHGLLRAYGFISPELRRHHPLALVCTNPAAATDALAEAERLGLAITTLAEVDDELLARLYRAAAVFAFPSLAEGFGLPPLEAMASGTPVVASTAPSVQEALGDAAVLVDPRDERAFAAALERVLADASLRESLAERGLRRAAMFSACRWAEDMLAIYERAASAKVHT